MLFHRCCDDTAAVFFFERSVGQSSLKQWMKKLLTVAAVIAIPVIALGVWVQSQTLQFGDFTWTHVGFMPLSKKSLHVVKYGEETLCADLLDVGEAPWVSANSDCTLTVSYGRVGSDDVKTVRYDVDKQQYLSEASEPGDGLDFNFDTLAHGAELVNFRNEVRRFSERVGSWSRAGIEH